MYKLIRPDMAYELLELKMKHIRVTGAAVVATGNPGCLLQVQNGCCAAGLDLRVVHPVTLLAEAYRAERNPS